MSDKSSSKICKKCGQLKELNEFSFRKSTQKFNNACRSCVNEQQRVAQRKRMSNPESRLKHNAKVNNYNKEYLKRDYVEKKGDGITKDT